MTNVTNKHQKASYIYSKNKSDMKKNIGSIDKVVRILAAIAIIAFYYAGIMSGLVATILLAVAVIFIATSFIGTCPLYLPFGLSTRKK
ncbi:MAG: DUF2892 domain-containing protein [Ekhidna sp.]